MMDVGKQEDPTLGRQPALGLLLSSNVSEGVWTFSTVPGKPTAFTHNELQSSGCKWPSFTYIGAGSVLGIKEHLVSSPSVVLR